MNTNEQRPKRVAIYARVSTDKQETQNQLVELREFASRQGWIVTKEYVDHVSGGRADRAEFQQLFADASKRLFDVCLFWSLDRWSREGAFQTLAYLERLKDYGVAFRSYTEPFIDSLGPFSDAIIALLGALAKQERVRLSERTRAGLARARAAGRVGGRPAISQKLRAKTIELRASGASMGQIAARLNISKMSVSRIMSASN
jgi:DNA invertase Pin-like site-specific DNA recombinase